MNRISIVLLLFLLATTSYSQTITGTFLGVVTDSNGATIEGVEVTAINPETGTTRTIYTNKRGAYVLSLLPIGRYTLIFEGSAFKQLKITGIPLGIDQKIRVDAPLEIGDIEVTIELTIESQPLIQTEVSESGEIIQNKRIIDLPLNGRGFLQLAQLTPGVVENAKGSFAQQLAAFSGPRISVMGARESDNFFTIDGVTATDRFFNTLSVPISVDAIQEFKVQSKLYPADAGTLGGAQVNIAIKSGTNDVHGSLYGFFRNDRLNARNYFDSTTKSKLRQGQFGATIGGPVIKDRVLYFGNYEGLRRSQSQARLFTVPTVNQRNGVFTTAIIDPSTSRPFANNTIQENRISLA